MYPLDGVGRSVSTNDIFRDLVLRVHPPRLPTLMAFHCLCPQTYSRSAPTIDPSSTMAPRPQLDLQERDGGGRMNTSFIYSSRKFTR